MSAYLYAPRPLPPLPSFPSFLLRPTTPVVMTRPTRILALSLLASLAVATPFSSHKLSRDLRLHDARDLPLGFSLDRAAAPDTPLSLRIALAPSDPAALTDALQVVSDPSSSSFRQYLSKADVRVPSL